MKRLSCARRWPVLLAAAVALSSWGGRTSADALARLDPKRLEAVHQAREAFRAQRQEIRRAPPYADYRAAIHLHSSFSHDSRGTLEEILAAAKATGTRVLLFSEHASERYDPACNGHRGLRDGVLLIPGVEAEGFLAFPTKSLRGLAWRSPEEYCDQVRSAGGLVFLSHVEERMDWEVRGLTGSEIYNTHADFKNEKQLIAALRNPLEMLKVARLFQQYPPEAFAAVQDYPADYLRRWDELCAKAPHTGIAANDSHENVGLVARRGENGKIRFEDALGKSLFEANAALAAFLAPLAKDKKAGDVLLRFQLDPYESSLRHVGTHLLLPELSEPAVRDALRAGRAFVAFDWLADAAGFDFAAVTASSRFEMGSRVPFDAGLKLRAHAPLVARWKLLRNGRTVRESEGRTLEAPVTEGGNYRVEAWLRPAGEDHLWILSNPVYVMGQK